MFECYDNTIGFTEFDCGCHTTGRPEDYNTSKSGLFLDELASIGQLITNECDKDMWTVLKSCMSVGTKKFVSESNALLKKHFTVKKQPAINQIIGQIKAKDTYTPYKNYAVIRIACNPIKGGYFTFKDLGTLFEATEAFTVSLYDNVTGFIVDMEVNSTANVLAKNAVAVEYPLYSKYVSCLEYYLVYQFDENNRPKNNKVRCSCGGVNLNYNTATPYFHGGYKAAPWTSYVMVGSNTINSLTELDDLPASASNNMLGLVLDLDFKCKINEVVCKDALDFEGNPLAMSIAFCIQYAVGVEVANRVIKNPMLVPQQLLDLDTWRENREEWQENYNEHLNYIIPKINLQATDCLGCKDLFTVTRRGLFA